MALTEYKSKRKLDKTPEPRGGKSTGTKLHFVIQKHAASHLHYDFRLEMRGTLKSWAVPKGPSLDPKVKRLAMLVEDHPFDYKDFEGIIPKGNYGAGTVIIWDQGTYSPVEKITDKQSQERSLIKQFYSGSIKFYLNGKKLKGLFNLIKAPDRGNTSWLLIKVKDQYSTTKDITLQDRSVVSKKTIEELTGDIAAKKWNSNKKSNKALKASVNEEENNDIKQLLSKARKAAMPIHITPMFCTLTKEPTPDDNYVHEIKWDGYRIIAYVDKSKVRLGSRSNLDYTDKYPPVVRELKALKQRCILDGEIVVFNEEGIPDFNAVQNYNGNNSPVSYCIFDILWIDGYDVKQLSLVERKHLLKLVIGTNDVLQVIEPFDNGPALYEEMVRRGLEGIVSKRKDSLYGEGERSNNWLKTPTRKRQEFVIGGWAESEKARSFRSLLFGAYNNGQFEWIGRSGGGYKEKEMPGILTKLKKLEIKNSPFVNKVLDTKGATIHWVKPELVANFEFAAWTNTGRIRKPATFLGFRKDKKAKDVVREVPKPIDKIKNENKKEEMAPRKHEGKVRNENISKKNEDSNWKELDKIEITNKEDFDIGDCTVSITNIERNVWKDIPKATLIQYYHSVAPDILPYLKDRPLSLHIKPYGATAPGLYIKDMEGREPECATIFSDKRKHPKPGKRNIIDYIVCNNEATLLWLINLGCIDLNPWMSRMQKPDQPDFINIDLDPSDDHFEKVIEVALAAKKILAKHRLKSMVKTSGKTGMHIYLPVIGINFSAARHYSEVLGQQIHETVPKISTTHISVDLRGDKVFIDPSQNDYADTLAAPYSARPYHLPTVSTPLDWKEVKRGFDPKNFTIETIMARIKKKGDLFKNIMDEKIAISNSKVLKKL